MYYTLHTFSTNTLYNFKAGIEARGEMKMGKSKILLSIIALVIVLIIGTVFVSKMDKTSEVVNTTNSTNQKNVQKEKQQKYQSSGDFEVLTGKEFTLTAKISELQIDSSTKKEVWTYNGTVPGPQIRVKKGDDVKIVLKNELPEAVTIHWHGLPVDNSQDGIPGVTMNAVQPGKSFTYQFKADVAGTYWYHSHQNGVKQVDKGLYGSFVVEDDNEEKIDKDYTVVLDEWMPGDGSMSDMDMGNDSEANKQMDENDSNSMNMDDSSSSDSMGQMNSMDNSEKQSMEGMSESEMMPLAYTIYTANGKSGLDIQPLKVKEGEKVRIRLVNAGFISHQLHLQGHDYKIVATDGQPINNPATTRDQLLNIAPGERYDIEFTADNPGKWMLDEHSKNPGAKDMTIPIVYEGATGADAKADTNEELPLLDITKYGEASQSEFSLNDTYDVEYNMDLNTKGNEFTINDKVYPNTPPINVKEGDLVKVKLTNNSPGDIHPMHLHGHFFQVLSKNGEPVSGSPLIKDTINVLPGEEYVVAFKADNPGNWLFHCHDLGHASQGMVTLVKYKGFKPSFDIDPNANNQPE